MSATWLPRGLGRIGFLMLALSGGLLAWRSAGDRLATDGALRGSAIQDPVIGRTLALADTVPLSHLTAPPLIAPPLTLRPASLHLINLFASWCVPCRAEAPVLARLAAQGVRIDGIAVRDDPATVQRFLIRNGDPFQTISLDPRGRVQARLETAGIPETYIVDNRERIIYRHRGALGPEDVAELTARLR